MSLFSRIKSLFAKRAYQNVTMVGGPNSDWALTGVSEDEDLQRNVFALIDRSRDLAKTNCYFRNYLQQLPANVFGAHGVTLQMEVMEKEDRVVYAEEKSFLVEKGRELGEKFVNERGTAKVKAGQLDLYASNLIENAWADWQRAETATITGRATYAESRQHRIVGACVDGDCFIRLIRDPKINKFGFTTQIIPAEYCNHNLNIPKTENGTEVRMGIEYDQWGREVAYYFRKPSQGNWQFPNSLYGSGLTNLREHERALAADCIHYGRADRVDHSRPAPWCASVIGKFRHLDKFEEAAVMGARVGACATMVLESTLVAEGGFMGTPPDPLRMPNTFNLSPGGVVPLPYGVSAKQFIPNSPNENHPEFTKTILRAICAALPGAGYSAMSGDYESVNYSAGKLDASNVCQSWMLLQSWDECAAERRIFEAWLEMALLTRAIPLPVAKFDKFNKPHFHYRRWEGIEVLKEANADAVNLANGLTTRTELLAKRGKDFEEVAMELAKEKAFLEEIGLSSDTTAKPDVPEEPEEEAGDDKPKPKNEKKEQPLNITVNVPPGRKTTKFIRGKNGLVESMEQVET